MGRKSKIDLLKEDIKKELATKAVDSKLSLDELTNWLNKKLEGEGLESNISKSGLGRYRKKLDKYLKQTESIKEVAIAFSKKLDLGDEIGALGLIANLLQSTILDDILTAKQDLSVQDTLALAKVVESLGKATHLREKVKKEYEEEISKKLETAVKKGKVPKEVATTLRNELGI